jgi:hypothetical protein
MVHQHLRQTSWWPPMDNWANGLVGLRQGPNAVLFVLLTAACTAVLVLPAWAARRLCYRRPPGGLPRRGDSFTYRVTPFRRFFLPLFYAAVPLLGCDYLAVELLGFLQRAPTVIPAAERVLGIGSGDSPLASVELMNTAGVVRVQGLLLVLGAVASAAVFWRVAPLEVATVSRAPRVVQLGGAFLMLLGGGLLVWFYNLTQGAAG